MSDHENSAPAQNTELRIAALALAFPPLFILLFALAVMAFKSMSGTKAGQDDEAVAARILPVARVELADTGGGTKGAKSGEELVAGVCGACHTAGVAGAPKLGDKAAWAPRIALGLDAMVKSATAGKNAMPPKGGADVSVAELTRAVVFMANKSGASFKEPSEKK